MRLQPGEVRSPDGFAPETTFKVPAGWFGGGDAAGWGIGQGLDEVHQRFQDVSISVAALAMPLAKALRVFRSVDGLTLGRASTGRLAGHRTVVFHAEPTKGPVGIDTFNGIDVNRFSTSQIFLAVGAGETLLIRTEVVDPQSVKAMSKVLQTFAFSD
jgi:hypothetical protein